MGIIKRSGFDGKRTLWPLGTDGKLTILNGETVTLTPGNSYDYAGIDVQAGGTLAIAAHSTYAFTEIGCLGDCVIDGTLEGDSKYSGTSQTTASETMTDSLAVSHQGGWGGAGGAGSGGAQNSPAAESTNGSPGTAGTAGSGGAVGPGGPGVNSGPTAPVATSAAGGSGNSNGTGGTSSYGRLWDAGFTNQGTPAPGGARGNTGSAIYLRVVGEYSGSGTINISGSAGSSGQDSGSGSGAAPGGGGGGSGGSGGEFTVRANSTGASTPSISKSGGSGGPGGAATPNPTIGGTGASGGSGSTGSSSVTEFDDGEGDF